MTVFFLQPSELPVQRKQPMQYSVCDACGAYAGCGHAAVHMCRGA